MRNMRKMRAERRGFTLIEILVVIAIVAILASILIPVSGKARETVKKRRANLEMQSIKIAILQYYADYNYMPWPGKVKAGSDKWVPAHGAQEDVMKILTAIDLENNRLNKSYLQIPEKSRPSKDSMVFNDPWGHPYYIGMDRDLDGVIEVEGTSLEDWDGKKVVEKVLVCSKGPENGPPMKTFDIR